MLPAVVGGVALMLVLTAGLGSAQLPVLLAWLLVPALLSTGQGERLAVGLLFGMRWPTDQERARLALVLAAASTRCGLPPEDIDWRVQPGRQLNACAAGRRTVAVTEGALQLFLAGRLPGDLFEAVLIHELGHHATRATRAGLATSWYAAPGRWAFRLVLRLAGAVGGTRRVGGATMVVAAVVGAVAIAQAVQQGQWLSVAILATLGVSLFVTPLMDGAVSRASEYAADRYAAGVGVGPQLARALTLLGGPGPRLGVRQRLLDRHPPPAARIARIV